MATSIVLAPAGSDIITPAYDTDKRPATFSAAEQADIIAIWRAVSEDFSAFDVDVSSRAWAAAGWALPGGLSWRPSARGDPAQ
jgi:hypothetical protein